MRNSKFITSRLKVYDSRGYPSVPAFPSGLDVKTVKTWSAACFVCAAHEMVCALPLFGMNVDMLLRGPYEKCSVPLVRASSSAH